MQSDLYFRKTTIKTGQQKDWWGKASGSGDQLDTWAMSAIKVLREGGQGLEDMKVWKYDSDWTITNLFTVSGRAKARKKCRQRIKIQDGEMKLRMTKLTKKKTSWPGEVDKASSARSACPPFSPLALEGFHRADPRPGAMGLCCNHFCFFLDWVAKEEGLVLFFFFS